MNIFIAWMDCDREIGGQLQTQLRCLPSVRIFNQDDIDVGQERRVALDGLLSQSEVAVVLLSAEMLQSDLFQRVMTRHRAGLLRVIPIHCRPCLFEEYPEISALEYLPRDRVVLSKRDPAERDETLAEIARAISRMHGPFDPARPMRQQATPGTSCPIDGVALIKASLGEADGFGAAIFAPPEEVVAQAREVCLILQFASRQRPIWEEVFRAYTSMRPAPFVALHLWGPRRTTERGEEFWLDDGMWEPACNSIIKQIDGLLGSNRPSLHLFFLTPNAASFAMGQYLGRFYDCHLYNYMGAPECPYKHVLHVPASRTSGG